MDSLLFTGVSIRRVTHLPSDTSMPWPLRSCPVTCPAPTHFAIPYVGLYLGRRLLAQKIRIPTPSLCNTGHFSPGLIDFRGDSPIPKTRNAQREHASRSQCRHALAGKPRLAPQFGKPTASLRAHRREVHHIRGCSFSGKISSCIGLSSERRIAFSPPVQPLRDTELQKR
jgi:hypothetical protein